MFGNSFTARRAVSLPEKMTLPGLRIPLQTDEYEDYFEDEKRSSLLPLSAPTSPGRTARRLTMGLRLRAARYSVPLILVSICLTALYFFAAPHSRAHGLQGRSRFHLKSYDSLHLPSRNLGGYGASNGVSLLQEEDELIAEEDLWWDKQPDHKPLTDKEKAAEAEIQAHKLDVMEQNRMGSLRALIWWIAEGGVFPADWEIPSKSYLKKVGARGMERLLEDIDAGTDDEAIFEDGWADFAKRRYRIAVFSKSYCPYSRKAKGILEEYHLTPAPFVIELDQRPDTHTIQTLLDHLTGRRTVPNIVFDFVPMGGSDDLMLLHSEGGLKRQFSDMGVIPGSIKRPMPMIPAEIPPPPGAPVQPVAPARAPPHAQNKPVAPLADAIKPHAVKPAVHAPKKLNAPAAQPLREPPMQHAFNPPALPLAEEDEEDFPPQLIFDDDEDLEDVPALDTSGMPMPDIDLEDDIGEMDDDETMSEHSLEDNVILTPLDTEDEDEDELPAFVPSAYEFDPQLYDDYEDNEAAVEIPKGASPADIRAAIQAAHGEDYLYQSDDDVPLDESDAAYVGNVHRGAPPAAAPARPNRIEAAAKKALHAGAEKVVAAVKERIPVKPKGLNAGRKPAAQPVVEVKKAERHPVKKADPLNHPQKVAHHPPPKAGAPPRNRVEAVAQKKAQAMEAIAEKKVEVAPKRKAVEQVAPPRRKGAVKADAAAPKGADARRRKGMDKVDAREVLRPVAKKDTTANNPNAAAARAPVKKAPANPAGGVNPLFDKDAPIRAKVPPVKKNAKPLGAAGKQEMKLAPVKKDDTTVPHAKKAEAGVAGARRKQGGAAGAKREPIAEVKKAGAVVKKDEAKDVRAARREKVVERAVQKPRRGAGAAAAAVAGGAKRAADAGAKPKQVARRKGKVL